jgi:hypothetical protein
MGLFSLAKLFGMTIRESANDGSDFTNPDADYRRLFLGEDGQLHVKDSAGAVTDIGAGSVATDAIWDTKGDLAAATGANTAAKLAAAANGSFLRTASGASTGLEWQLNNLSASAAPTVNEDSGDGYSIGSRWLDTTNDKEYVATDVTAGAAVWKETTAGGSITVSENFLTSAVTISSTNTFFDGPSLSLAAGTYLLDAVVTIDVQTSAHFTAKIWDGTTLMSPTPEHFHATNGGQLAFALHGYVVLGGTTTVKVSVAANNGTNNAIDNTGATNATANKSSYLRATKIA